MFVIIKYYKQILKKEWYTYSSLLYIKFLNIFCHVPISNANLCSDISKALSVTQKWNLVI